MKPTGLIAVAVAAVLASGCGPGTLGSAVSADAQAVVAVQGGAIGGRLERGQAVFRGVPFAAPPTGDLRWRSPQPVKAWSGVRQATRFGDWCPQGPRGSNGSEDCLTLNIWAPEWPVRTSRPVMVYLHGGGNRAGGSGDEGIAGAELAKRGVVVVSVNYRLGLLGFFAHPELTRESPHHASGNYGLMDQIAALQWVKDNIRAFGGDPDAVTLFGHSAGGQDVVVLTTSPLSKGLFHRAIAQSSNGLAGIAPLADQEQSCRALAARLKPAAGREIPDLRSRSVAEILSLQDGPRTGCRSVSVDGWVLPEQPSKVFAERREHPVQLIAGSTPREWAPDTPVAELRTMIAETYGPLAPRAIELYGLAGGRAPATHPIYGTAGAQWKTDVDLRCWASLEVLQHSRGPGPAYQYEFEVSLPGQDVSDATHSNELPYVFGGVATGRYAGFSERDRRVSEEMLGYWTNFAKTGDPNGPGLPQWPRFTEATRSYLQIAQARTQAQPGLRRPYCDLFIERNGLAK